MPEKQLALVKKGRGPVIIKDKSLRIKSHTKIHSFKLNLKFNLYILKTYIG